MEDVATGRSVDRRAPTERHAVVAAVLRDATSAAPPAADAAASREASGAEVLLIRRALNERDPWSGHMALPGGHPQEGDDDLVRTATRETFEEVRLDLETNGRLLARLGNVRAATGDRSRDLTIVPLVFALDRPARARANPAEVQEIVWTPLEHLLSRNAKSVHTHHAKQRRYRFPAFDVEGHLVWGVTYRILENLLSVLTPPRAELDDGTPAGTG